MNLAACACPGFVDHPDPDLSWTVPRCGECGHLHAEHDEQGACQVQVPEGTPLAPGGAVH